MENFEVQINLPIVNNDLSDILIALLSDFGFDGFIEEQKELRAFIGKNVTTEEDIKVFLSHLPIQENITFNIETLENKNWNEEWEKNFFQPIKIANDCLIRSTFHQTQEEVKYEILIDPKMSFGTGHHSTTHLMVEALLTIDLKGKSVLDMGCGTGILAILASMRGSNPITAIDIDPWSYTNALENIKLNKTSNISVQLGGAELLGSQHFDVIIANINRNILLEDIKHYSKVLKKEGTILFSGFYLSDLELIKEEANKHGMIYQSHNSRLDWVMAKFIKQ